MKKDNKKALYENIMTSVAKEVKKALNESNNRFYPEDYNAADPTELIEAICDALLFSGIIETLLNAEDNWEGNTVLSYFGDLEWLSKLGDALIKFYSDQVEYIGMDD